MLRHREHFAGPLEKTCAARAKTGNVKLET
jgi:hypothetical protein